MKKFFTLITLLATVGVLSMQAQAFQKAPFKSATASSRAQRAIIEPGANQVWWGYVSNNTSLSGLGVQAKDTYHCAIFIPGNHVIAGGKTIQAVRFGLVAPNATNAKVWIASKKPSTIDNTNCIDIVDVPQSDLGNINIDIPLNTPYTIPSTGVYVGYSFTISAISNSDDQFPILITGSDAPNTLIIKTDTNVPSWSDMNGQGFGSLFLQVLLEGDFGDNDVTPLDFGPVYGEINKTGGAAFVINNNGYSPVSSVDYIITTDGNDSQEFHATIEPAVPGFSAGYMGAIIPAEAEQCIKNKTLTITKVNGNENNATDKTASFTMYSLSEIIDRTVIVEQFTGTGCGWCPRGHVGMAKMREAFGDRFAGVALHQYSGQSSDAMNIATNKYAKLSFSGAPSARINRGAEVDPYYGSYNDILEDMNEELAIPALAEVQVSGNFNEDKTKVDAKANLRPLFDGTYKLEFVLVADGLTGTGSGWNQTNYYSYAYASQTGITKAGLPDDLKYLYDTPATFNPIFNDVAIASSYVSGSNKVPAQTLTSGETSEVSYTVSMPTYTKLKNALQYDQIYVLAILIDSSNKVVNVAKAKVADYDPTGISAVSSNNATETVRYTLDGRQITAPQHGLNIIKMSDGTVRKVVVK
jgi:hypothetical protein